MSFDFAGFGHGPNGNAGQHQDVRFDVVESSPFRQDLMGRATTHAQYPFVWPASGRATVTVPLRSALQAATYQIVIYLGPNYHRYADLKLDLRSAASTAPSPLPTP